MPHIESKFVRVDHEDDPERCQGQTTQGQRCPYKAMPGVTHCPMHGGPKQQESKKKETLRNYRLQLWNQRVAEFGDSEGVKSLRDEIGITRLLLENVVNRCQDSTELILYAPRIGDLVMKIEKLVTSCHKLEASTGLLLDKSAALVIAGKIVEVVSRFVTDPDAVDKIATEICETIVGTGGIPDAAKE